jgi:YD repeat-containing protein
VPSTVIRKFEYDAAEQRLAVHFTNGRRYSYHDVPAELYEAMKGSFAKGEFFNAHIRGRFRFSREQ